MTIDRRRLLVAAASLGAAAPFHALARSALLPPPPEPQDNLPELSRQLAALPRRRQFATIPRVLDHPDLWDDAAFEALVGFRGRRKMLGAGADLSGHWPVEAQNLINSEVFSFGHPDALLVMALWGEAQLALYDAAAWTRFDLARLVPAGETVSALQQPSTGSSRHHQDEQGAYGIAGRGIPALQARGVVFLACHNAIWSHAGRILALGGGSVGGSQEQIAAELTNHINPRAIVTPSALGAMAELQGSGFSRIF
ncbi:transcriptional initiation protein Tat [Asaia astilbis]